MWIRRCVALAFVLALAGSSSQAQEKKPITPKPPTLAEGKFGKALDARIAPAIIEGSPRFGQPPLTVECWAKVFSKKQFNVLVASDAKSSSSHWEIYTYTKTGEFSAYLPGVNPSEIKSGVDVCDSNWHHLAMTYDGKVVQLFIDGKRVVEKGVEKKPGPKAETGSLTVGMAYDGKQQQVGCDGLIDEVRLSGMVREFKEVPAASLPFDPKTMLMHRFDRLEDLTFDPAWTPPPGAGNVPNWEKATDKDWIDPRFREMDTGPILDATFEYPTWRGAERSYKGTAIRIGDDGKAAVLFDRNQLRLAAGWTGDCLQHSSRRFGLLNTPKPAGEVRFTTASGPGWANATGEWKPPTAATAPLPGDWAKYRGLYLNGNRIILSYTVGGAEVLESPWAETVDGVTAFSRTVELTPVKHAMHMLVCDLPGPGKQVTVKGVSLITAQRENETTAVWLRDTNQWAKLHLTEQGRVEVHLTPGEEALRFKLLIWHGPAADLPKFADLVKASPRTQALGPLTRAGPTRWTKPVITQGVVSKEDKPYVIDTITMPYDNPYKALMFGGGIDFLPNGDLAVCTAHGDVWLVQGVDDKLERLTWKRFATGLYQPLGLKVVDGVIHVLERGQITRLHDRNGDGEADFYENFCNDWHTGGGEHSFDTCLETDPQGNFYFLKTGDTHTPSGGCLYRVAKDGSKAEIFATGFRHPIGLSVSPTGIVTGADQEGNWMPATRIDQYKQGGFYGDMRAHHREKPPTIYDNPLCWLPREVDNSAGGQIWVPPDRLGPLGGQLLHLSYGRCKLMLLMRQEVEGQVQGGGVDLGLTFLSGVMRGRVNPRDGHLYVTGLNGWQTAAKKDGCVERVRYTGKPVYMPTGLAAHEDGLRLTFSQPLDRKTAEEIANYTIEQWNYRWSAEYGSKRWSVQNPDKIGQDKVALQSAKLLPDGRSVFLHIDGLKAVMQMQIRYGVKAADGQAIEGMIHNTIHRLAPRQ